MVGIVIALSLRVGFTVTYGVMIPMDVALALLCNYLIAFSAWIEAVTSWYPE